MRKNYLFFTLIVVGTAASVNAQTIRHVKQGAVGSGVSWQDASGDLQAVINASAAGDRVYVAEGTYIPNHKASNDLFEWLTNNPRGVTNDKAKAFVLKEGVGVYGGFSATTPVTDLSLRNFDLNETLITTDVLGNDAGFANTALYTDNYYHAVIAAGITTGATLDGFTIEGGTWSAANDYDYIVVNGTQVQQGFGGALMIVEANVAIENVKINNTGRPIYVKTSASVFKDLSVTNSFGQFEVHGSTITIENMNFSDNNGSLYLSALYNLPNNTFATLKNVVFARNTASAISIWRDAQKNTTLEIDRAQFIGNHANSYGIVQNNGGNFKMSNSIATGNTSGNQSGFIVINTLNPSIITNVEFVNCTIVSNRNNFDWGNGTGAISGGAATNAHIKIRNSIIWGNKMGDNYRNVYALNNPNFTVGNSIIQDAFDTGGVWNPNYGVNSGGNSATIPNFTQFVPVGTTAFSSGDFSLAAGSPGINSGDITAYSTLVAPSYTKDLAGNDRIMGTAIDIGAFEYLEALSIKETDGADRMVVYPNPASDKIFVAGADFPATFEMYNMAGQLVLSGKVNAQQPEIQVGILPVGTYILKVNSKANSYTQKVIKK